MTRPQTADLNQSGYEKELVLDAAARADFYRKYMRRRSWIVLLFYFFILSMLLWFLLEVMNPAYTTSQYLLQFIAIFPLTFAVTNPLHEAIHGLGFWLFGARNLRWGGSWRKLSIQVQADGFVASAHELMIIRLLPVLIITPLLSGAAALLPGYRLLLLGLLTFHTSTSLNDLSMVNYLYQKRTRHLLAVDDASTGTTTFYHRIEQKRTRK